jgi:hypothetical protein
MYGYLITVNTQLVVAGIICMHISLFKLQVYYLYMCSQIQLLNIAEIHYEITGITGVIQEKFCMFARSLLLLLLLIPSVLSISTLTQEQKDAQERLNRLREEYTCMYNAMYYEANNQGREGLRAVYEVIRNRANYSKESWCVVISKKKQFSFLNSGKIKLNKKLDKQLEDGYYSIIAATEDVLPNEKVMFYHTTSVNPVWNRKMERVKRIKSHLFFKKKD